MIKIDLARDNDGKLPSYAWPGGYPIFYFTADGGVLCPACANGLNGSDALVQDDPQWNIEAREINWEDPAMHCDHCNTRIESAYSEDEADIDRYDGESGAHLLSMPQEAAQDCSTPGQSADESVRHWRARVRWIADESTLRASLRGYGAWDDLDTADLDTIKDRVLWIAACDWREEARSAEDAEVRREEDRIEDGQSRWSETGRTRKD